MAYVVVRRGGREKVRAEIVGGSMVIGRASECDLSIGDARLSRLHCRIEEESPGKWALVDLGSKNGTFFKHEKIERVELTDDDHFEIGEQRITFHSGAFVPKRPKNPLEESRIDNVSELSESATGTDVLSATDAEGTRYAVKIAAKDPATLKVAKESSTLMGKPLAFQRPPAAPKVAVTIEEDRITSVPKRRRLRVWLALLCGIGALAAFYWYFLLH